MSYIKIKRKDKELLPEDARRAGYLQGYANCQREMAMKHDQDLIELEKRFLKEKEEILQEWHVHAHQNAVLEEKTTALEEEIYSLKQQHQRTKEALSRAKFQLRLCANSAIDSHQPRPVVEKNVLIDPCDRDGGTDGCDDLPPTLSPY